MRFLNSLRNSALALLGQVVSIVLGFGVRWVFVRQLGQEYLGVNSVMESVLMILSMAELGIGTSVAFALYKPIANGDEKRIASLMAFYKLVYRILGIGTAVIGPLLIPFMGFFTREAVEVAHINAIYLLFVLNTVLSYFFSYKRTLFSACQKHYVVSVAEDGMAVLKYTLQALVLLRFGSYIGYLLINLLCGVSTNLILSVLCDKQYPYLKTYKKEKLCQEDREKLKKSVVSLMVQKICAKLVTSTDNLMISYAKLTLMGVYSNYSMVVSTISRVVYQVLRSILGSVGDLMVQKDGERKYRVFQEFAFANFCCYFFFSVGISACLERFLVLWAGEEWLLSPAVTFVVVMNFFLHGQREANVVVIEAAGIFNHLRMKAVGEVVVNLAVSYLFLAVFQMGIYGVLLGTTVSMVSVCIWWEVWAVHKYALHRPVAYYYRGYFRQLFSAAVGCFAAYGASAWIPVDGLGGLLLAGLGAVGIFLVMLLLFHGRTREFRALLERFGVRV